MPFAIRGVLLISQYTFSIISKQALGKSNKLTVVFQIKALKDQVSDLRRNPEYDDDRMRDFESLQSRFHFQLIFSISINQGMLLKARLLFCLLLQ